MTTSESSSPKWFSRTKMMKLSICATGVALATSFVAHSMFLPTIIECVIAQSHVLDKQDAELTAKAARVKSILDGLQCFLYLLIAPLLGTLSDTYGRKMLLFAFCLSGALLFAFLIVGYYFLWMWCLFAAKMLGCVFVFSQILSSCLSYMGDVSGAEDKAKNFGLVMGAVGLGLALSPTPIGFLASEDNLVLPLFAGCVIIFVTLLFVMFVLPESLHYGYDKSTLIRQKPKWLELINPFKSLSILFRDNRYVMWLSILFLMYCLGESAVYGNVVLYTRYRYGWTTKTLGLVFTINGVLILFTQGKLLGIITKNFGERKAALFAIAMGCLVNAAFGLAYKGWMFVVAEAAQALVVMANPAIQALVSQNIAPERRGQAISGLATINVLAQFFGYIGTENMFAYFISKDAFIHLPGAQFFVASIVFLVGFVGGVVMFRKYDERKVEELKFAGDIPPEREALIN